MYRGVDEAAVLYILVSSGWSTRGGSALRSVEVWFFGLGLPYETISWSSRSRGQLKDQVIVLVPRIALALKISRGTSRAAR